MHLEQSLVRRLPEIIKKVKKQDNIIVGTSFIIFFIISISNLNSNYILKGNILDIIILFISGLLEAIGTVVPGVSSSALLMILGTYNIILSSIGNITSISVILTNIKIIIPFLLGVFLGIITLIKIIDYLLKKHENKLYSFVLGVLLSSIILLIIKVFKEKITIVDKPQEAVREMHFSLEPYCVSGNDVLTVEHLSKQFDTQLLFQDVSFEIKRGEHVAVIGDNGTGKTTLLKILNQVIKADNGSFTLGAKVQIGYYDQEHHVLHDDKTIFEEISDDYPHLTNTEIRNTLAAFQFTGDEVFQVIHSLSGGEKGRVSLAKLMLSEANFLILDEPTNHLDIASKEILEEALNNYTGTILYVSHDRYFINSTASRILELINQTFVNYIGNYDYYLEKKDELTQTYASSQIQRQVSTSQNGSETLPADGAFLSDSKLSWQEQKEQQAKERKRKSELKKTEDEIALLENRNGEIDFQMTLEEVYSNSVKCQELSTERTKNELRLEELYEKWGELAE